MRFVPRRERMPQGVWISIAGFAAALSAIVLALNLTRLVLYPRKVLKDWDHPSENNLTHLRLPSADLFPERSSLCGVFDHTSDHIVVLVHSDRRDKQRRSFDALCM
jgi:hypothetical protein